MQDELIYRSADQPARHIWFYGRSTAHAQTNHLNKLVYSFPGTYWIEIRNSSHMFKVGIDYEAVVWNKKKKTIECGIWFPTTKRT